MSIRKPIVALAGAALAAGLSIGLGGTAYASDPALPSGTWNEIFIPFDNVAGNRLCVDVPDGSTSAGVQLQFYHCHGYDSDGTPQRWRFVGTTTTKLGGIFFGYIQNTGSGLCIGPQGGSLNSGVRLVQESCSQAPFWVIHPQNDDGTNPLIDLEMTTIPATGSITPSNLCMAAGNMGDGNHTPLVATTCQPLQPTPGDLAQVLEI